MAAQVWTKATPIILAGGVLAAAIAYRAVHPAGGAVPAPAADAPAPAAAIDPPPSLDALHRAAMARPADAAAWQALAHAAFAAGDYAAAADADARVAGLCPADAAAWSALGEARTLAANAVTAPAHAAFARAVALDPKDPRARYFLGVEKDVAGDHRGAVEAWTGVLRDAPPGAPYADSIRRLLTQVGAADRLPPAPPMPAAPARSGTDVAAAAIPGPSADDLAAARQLTPGQQDAMARGMVDRLAARLRQAPHDLPGWIRLMRAEQVLGDRAAAQSAWADARRAFAADPQGTAALAAAAAELGLAPPGR